MDNKTIQARKEAFRKFVENHLIDEDFTSAWFSPCADGKNFTAQFRLEYNVNEFKYICYHLHEYSRNITKLTTVASKDDTTTISIDTVIHCSLAKFFRDEKLWEQLTELWLEDTTNIWH